jgi:hypothetical protein
MQPVNPPQVGRFDVHAIALVSYAGAQLAKESYERGCQERKLHPAPLEWEAVWLASSRMSLAPRAVERAVSLLEHDEGQLYVLSPFRFMLRWWFNALGSRS